jgi:hypothetical protein
VLHALAHHCAATRPRNDHIVLDIEADGEGQHGVGAQLCCTLAEAAPRDTLQPLEHLQRSSHSTILRNCCQTSRGTFMRCTLLERPLRNVFLV